MEGATQFKEEKHAKNTGGSLFKEGGGGFMK